MGKKASKKRKSNPMSTAKPVCGEVATEPANKGESDADVVAEAGRRLSSMALEPPKDDLLVSAANTMRGVWYMLRGRDDRARRALRVIEKTCTWYTDGLSLFSPIRGFQDWVNAGDPAELLRLMARDEWLLQKMPSRPKWDRHRNAAILLQVAETIKAVVEGLPDRLKQQPKGPIPDDDTIWKAVVFFLSHVRYLFPDISAAAVGTYEDLVTRIAETWRRKAKAARNDGKELKGGPLVESALAALGMDRNDAHNLMLGVRDDPTTESAKPQTREQDRDNHGRFATGEDPTKD